MFVTCCAWMNNAMARVGSDAIAVVVSLEGGEPLFFLQGRPFTHSRSLELESRLKDPEFRRAFETFWGDAGTGVALHLHTCTMIQFCPGCGAALEALARRQPREFEALASEHHPYLVG